MATDGTGMDVPPSTAAVPVLPSDVVDAVQRERAGTGRPYLDQRPPWVDRFVWNSLFKLVAVGLLTAALLTLAWQTQTLLRLLGVSLFFALAMVPGVDNLTRRRGWKRGSAVGVIYLAVIAFVVFMIVVLIPAIEEFANQIQVKGPAWADQLNNFTQERFGRQIIAEGGAAADQVQAGILNWAQDNFLGAAASGLGFVFNLATVAMFTFYLAADYPRIQRALMSRMSPDRQRVFGWVSDTSVAQTGGYFYSRMLLVIINGSLAFIVMLLIGLPLALTIPLAIFMGFVSEFIPAIGTYIGAAIPLLVVLAVQGVVPALILLGWVLVYQQLENYYLSPKLSAHTMEVNGAVAFGAALAGGAIAGPMGAFMALPMAALITAIIKNTGRTYEVVYDLKYDSHRAGAEAVTGTATATDG